MAALRKKKFESLIKKEGGGGGDEKPRRSSMLQLPTNIVGETGTSPIDGRDDPAGSPGTTPAAAAAVSPPRHAEVKSPLKGVSGAARIPSRSSSCSEERREERAKTNRLQSNGSPEERSRTNSNKSTATSTSTSSSANRLGDEAPQAQAVPTKATGGSSEGRPAPKDSPGEKAREREKLREQLQKLVSNKLSTLGDLDHAGLVALEALSKMPPPPGTTVPRQPGSPHAGGNATGGGRPRKNLPPGLEKVPRFTGKNVGALSDTLNRFHSLVVAALPGSPHQAVNRALLRDVVFILEGSALKFYDELKGGKIQWEAVPPVAGGAAATEPQATKPYFQPPSTWAQVCEAFHDHYLPAQGIARTAATLVSLSQAPGESVRSLAARQLGLTHHLNRLIAADGGRTSFWDAISIGLFERALRLDLRRMQSTEVPCSSFESSVNRAERNAALADTVVQSKEGGGGGTAVNEGGSGSDGKLHPGETQGHVGPNASTSGHDQQQQDVLRSSDRIGDSAGVPPVGVTAAAAAAAAGAAAAEEDVPSNVGMKRSVSQMSDDLVTVKCEGAAAGTDSPLLVDARRVLSEARARVEKAIGSNDGKDSDDVGYLNGGDVASDLLGDGGSQPFENASRGAMVPVADDGPMPPRPCRQEPGGRERSGDFGGSREERKRNNKKERKRQRDWHDGNAGGGNCPRPIHGELVGDRPPCTVPQCKAINRQFHCTNECFFHPEHGKYGRPRAGGRRRPARTVADREPAEFGGYNNFGLQRAPYTDTFGTEHYF
eukprot:jgi/Undpi1/6292/HiC_scaffold_20.g08776.m1